MGHLAGKEEILKQLRARLHKNPIGLPEHSSIFEILSILFTEKEAEVGARFPLGVVNIEELQKAVGKDKDELEGILKGRYHHERWTDKVPSFCCFCRFL
jgi:hypothetical protein